MMVMKLMTLFGAFMCSVVVGQLRFLDDYSVEEVGAWLTENRLSTFADRFQELEYDGEVLTQFLKPDEVSLEDFPGATLAHVSKLFHRIERDSRLGATTATDLEEQAPRRRLDDGDTTSGSGIRIKSNESSVIMGALGDVALSRGGYDRLSTDNEFYVQGIDVARAALGLSAGGVAWDFSSPVSKHYLRSAQDLILPPHFTIEFWMMPRSNAAGEYFFSWATEDNMNCLLLQSSGFDTVNDWHHVVVTYDRRTVAVHDNGALNSKLIAGGEFCGGYNGSLVLGQEQDQLGAGFQWSQGASMLLDTVAIYNRDFSEAERRTVGKTCVDVTDPNLVTLWTGYTRGADQVGTNQAEVFFDGFADGASNQSCTNKGVGLGVIGQSYDRYETTHVTPAVGAVGWVFPGQDTSYHFLVPELTLPLDFTIELWVYPLNSTDGTYFLSWATPNNHNCFLLKAFGFSELRVWHHVVITWDGLQSVVYVNGELGQAYVGLNFCDEYTGSLSIGQEQDGLASGYSASQAPAFILDTVAIYSTAWTIDEVLETEESPCIDLGRPDLYALYSGYSRGKDLVGGQDGTVTAIEILSPGQPTTSGEAYDWFQGDVVFDLEACQKAQDQVDATPPDFDNSLVGGVGWDFDGESLGYYFATALDYIFPDEFTIEFWMYPRTNDGYVVSFATETDYNCLLMRNSKLTAVNQWHHIVLTVSQQEGVYTTTGYINGTETSSLSTDFCGVHNGSLVLAQEQDDLGGRFDITQATNAIIDTLAIYNTAWTAEEVGVDKPVGVDLKQTDLYSLYSGFTKGKDLIGTQDAIVWLYQFADGMYNSDANAATLDMISPVSVGGVAWDFPGDSVEYWMATNDNFALPTEGFAFEMWVKAGSLQDDGHFLSYAVPSNFNCLLVKTTGFLEEDVGVWRHLVVTFDAATQSTYAYLDGVERPDFLWADFCGETDVAGALVIAQDQDSILGGYVASQAADVAVDTIAIYSSHWDSEQVNLRKGQCVDLHDPTLFTLWSGYTRGKDLVGTNDIQSSIFEWVEGASLDCDY